MWWLDPHIQTLIVGAAAALSGLGAFLRGRANGKALGGIQVLVNGRAAQDMERNRQLLALLLHNGIEVPPPPDVSRDMAGNIVVIKVKENGNAGNSEPGGSDRGGSDAGGSGGEQHGHNGPV